MRRLILTMLVSVLFASSAWATNWGTFKNDGCVRSGHDVFRRYSSVLWNIPRGVSWEVTCKRTAGTGPTSGYKPSRCEQSGGHMWGVFLVPDSNCPRSSRPWKPLITLPDLR